MVDRPDPLSSPLPTFGTAAAASLAADRWGVRGELTALAGERDQNFRVDTPDGQRFLFKISNAADLGPVLAMQTAALAHIERADPALPVMRTLPDLDGRPWTEVTAPDGRTCPVRLFSFLPGRVVPAADLTIPAIRAYGQVTARLGRALRGFFHAGADYEIRWDLSNAQRIRPLTTELPAGPRREQAERILDRFASRVAPVLPGLRAQVIHGDLSLGNVLLDDGLRVSGIVDFGDMTHAPLVCDLAVAVADTLQDRPDALAAAAAMIGGYTTGTPLEDEEAALLADLVAARLAMAVTLVTWQRNHHPGQDFAASTDRAFLDQLEAVGLDEAGRRFRDAARGLPYRAATTGDLLERRQRVLPRSPLFYRHPVHLTRGEGAWLFDAGGRRYLDCYNNVAVAGHAHPHVIRAVTAQQRLLATHSRYLHEGIVELAERLTATLPPSLDAVLVVNSGSEANDLAWRIARAATGRSGAVVTAWAYHGITAATHALSPEVWAPGERPGHVATIASPDGYRGPYRREQAGWAEQYGAQVTEAAAMLGDHGLAAMFADPVCTADGVLVPPPGYLHEAARRIRDLGGLLVADEVQAGHGRTGTHLWAFQAAAVEPDLVVMGKPMGNGFPVAAVVTRSELLAAVPAETEVFSTFGGNPVACAAALAVLDVIEAEDLLANAAVTGDYLRAGLAALAGRHPVIGDVRGAGLLVGAELVEDRETRFPASIRAQRVTEAARDRGVLLGSTGPAGNVLKIRPPLVFRREHADLLLSVLDDALAVTAP